MSEVQANDVLEIKSGDLTAKCPASRGYYRAGKFDAIVPKAMARGLMAGKSIELLLDKPEAEMADIPVLVREAEAATMEGIRAEGRVCGKWEPDVVSQEVLPVIGFFLERVVPWINDKGWKLIGQEVPIRWQIDEQTVFASHLDALFSTEDGAHHLILDWKWTKDAPTYQHCDMDLQMRAYRSGLVQGELYFDGWWTPIHTQSEPKAALIWLPGLLPYTRRTSCTVNGEPVVFLKGDERPFNKVYYSCSEQPLDIPSVEKQVKMRADWIRSGILPEIPTAEGCMLCSCKQWCSTTQQVED